MVAVGFVTRRNLMDLGERAGAVSCWGVEAPEPSLHFVSEAGSFCHAFLGDVVVRVGRWTMIAGRGPLRNHRRRLVRVVRRGA